MMLLAMLAAAAVPQPAELKLFTNWTVGCDNGHACQAVALMPENWPEEAVTMSVSRGAEPEAAPVVRIALRDKDGVSLAADGRPVPIRLIRHDDYAEVAAADVPALVTALRTIDRLDLIGPDGTAVGVISLEGASAALLYMDDRQGRVGTVTALARPGQRPASAMAPAPPLPVIRAPAMASAAPIALSEDRIDALRREHGCTIDEVGGPEEHETVALDADHSLVLLACGSGAYNVSTVLFVAEKRSPNVRIGFAPFDVQPDWWENGRPILTNGGWDTERGLLTAFSKARGLGDCGTITEYAWDGARFRLVLQTEMDECRGSIDYIPTWRATVVRP